MALSREEVLHVASLCRIHLADEEVSGLQQQLSDTLEQFELLKGLDTEGVVPANHAAFSTVMRPDTPQTAFPVEEILANAPHRERGFFRVLVVLEE